MKGEMVYMASTEEGKDHPLEVYYEYIPGRRLNLQGDPDTWHPTELAEVYIHWVIDLYTGSEMEDKAWQAIIDEDCLVEAILKEQGELE